MESADITAEYSNRRPHTQAWRVCHGGHVTYAADPDTALRLHQIKLKTLAEMDKLLCQAAKLTIPRQF